VPRREIAGRAGVFALLVLLGWLAWTPLAAPFARTFCALNQLVLSHATYGAGGHLTLEYAPLEQGAQREQPELDASWNARLRLSVDGTPLLRSVRVNPRRLGFLPLVLFLALTAALPLRARGLAVCVALGTPLVLLNAVGSVWLTALWVFTRLKTPVYVFSPWQRSLVDFAYEGLVTPLGNKLIFSFLVAFLLFALADATQSSRARHPASAHGR
jgi:hypothetical protein